MLRQRQIPNDKSKIHVDRSASFLSSLKKLDVYNKVHEDYAVKTGSGGLLTILCWVTMLGLLIHETFSFVRGNVEERIIVDSHIDQPLAIEMDVSFPFLSCHKISVDTVDALAKGTANVSKKMTKIPLPPLQYDPEDMTSYDLWESFSSNIVTSSEIATEGGCRVRGRVLVNKVAGNIHVALGQSHMKDGKLLHEFNFQDVKNGFNVSHLIHELSFTGSSLEKEEQKGLDRRIDEGVRDISKRNELSRERREGKNGESPLAGSSYYTQSKSQMKHYYIKLIPTTVIEKKGVALTNQYSVTSTAKEVIVQENHVTGLPGVYFVYDFSPFLVEKKRVFASFGSYVSSIATIIGGVYVIFSIMDSVIYHAVKKMKQ